MRCALPRPLMALPLAVSLVGQSAEPALPFVGCVSYGQASKAEAPAAVSVRRTFSRHDMENLAYYQSAEIGLVAPKGWNCEGFSDSSGWGMFLSPEPIKGEPRWPSCHGPARAAPHKRRERLWTPADRGSSFTGFPHLSCLGNAKHGGDRYPSPPWALSD